ncbi:MAG TPA: GAF domain-containing protein [Vicinamibacterales bacterium]|nr:GAF domain-containing protein [Vicinamibacterales bacterium]
MSSPFDDHIRAVLDRLRVTLGGQLEAEVAASTGDLVRAVADEHRQALIEATERTATETRLEAEQHLTVVRGEFDRHRENLERHNEGLQQQNGALLQEKEELRREKEDVQQGAASEIAGLERALGEARDELETARRNLDDAQSVHDSLRFQLEEIRQEHERRTRELQDAIERAGREAEQTRSDADASTRELETIRARLAQTTRLTSALRTLDEATSLGDILDHLAHSACQESGRTAVFLVNGQKLRGWRALGFENGDPIVGSDFEPVGAGVVGRAARLAASQRHRNGDNARLPSFASAAAGPRDAVALPVQVGGSVIAVLYADSARTDTPEDPEWLDTIDTMTKHAGRALEAMTVRQAAALWTPRHGAKRRSQAGGERS